MTEAAAPQADRGPLIIGRYALFDVLASGGMATVHLGRLLGSVGFARTVAIKRLHAHFSNDPEFVAMFMDEARIVARIRHPNVVPMVDVIDSPEGLLLVMEYVHGESLSRLLRQARATNAEVPLEVASAVMHGALLGLHAAHETKGPSGELLDVVHRDVSPQNIIVGVDGVARVLDFGVAKAAGRAQVTREGQIKGKLTYMAPEQIRGKVDRRADIFAASIVLWEALAGRRMYEGSKDVDIVTRIVKGNFDPPSKHRSTLPPELDAIVLKGLSVDVAKRYSTARELALELERTVGLASPSEVGEWVESLASDVLRARAERISAMERVSSNLTIAKSTRPPAPEPSSSRLPATTTSGHHPSLGAGMDSAGVAMGEMTMQTSTPAGTEVPAKAPDRPRDLAPLIAVGSFLGALAVVGFVLGAWALLSRPNTPAAAPALAATTTGPAAPAAPSATATAPLVTAASSAPAASSEPGAAASAEASTTAAEASSAPARRSTVLTTTASTPLAPTLPKSQAGLPTGTATPSAKKKGCDPPYTVDEAGHRKYKLECMD